MLTPFQAKEKYGMPDETFENKYMVTWPVPDAIGKKIPALPREIYMHKDVLEPFKTALSNIIDRKLENEFYTWDGSFDTRKPLTLKAWGLAFHVNTAWPMSKEFIACFTDAGLEWTGAYKWLPAMRFQIKGEEKAEAPVVKPTPINRKNEKTV